MQDEGFLSEIVMMPCSFYVKEAEARSAVDISCETLYRYFRLGISL